MTNFFKLLNIDPEVEVEDIQQIRYKLQSLLNSGKLLPTDIRAAKHVLPQSDISSLIQAHADDNTVELGCIIAQYPSFKRWQRDPGRARIEWLTDLYISSQWITANERLHLLSLDPAEAIEHLRNICLHYSYVRSNQEVLQIQLNDEKRANRANLKQLLKIAGIKSNNLLWRYLRQEKNYNTTTSKATKRWQ